MAYQFRPGQKVRFIGESAPEKHFQTGDVGEFVTYKPEGHNKTERFMLIVLSMRGDVTMVEAFINGHYVYCGAEELVPVDDGAEGSTWENCAWSPSKIEA